MWEKNREFQKAIIGDLHNLTEKDRVELTKETLLHISSEQTELLKALGKWKTVLQEDKPPSLSGVLTEVIDIYKFLVNICLFWNLEPIDFLMEFERKTEVNWQKFRQKTNPIDAKDKIAVFDLDGVLANYPDDWIEFAISHSTSCFMPRVIKSIDGSHYYDIPDLHHIAQTIDISQQAYDVLKAEWRETGQDGKLEKIPMADSILMYLRSRGYKIMILTRRPVQEYKRIYADTILWLRSNSIPFDGIFWSDGEKEKELMVRFSDVRFIVEDDPVQAENFLAVGFKVFLLDKPYNRQVKQDARLIVIHSLEEIKDHLEEV
jgi:phosphoglycolate phosphatase-like HAD superfamily hydrolase